MLLNRLQLGMQILLPHTNAWEMLDYTLNHFVMVILYNNKEITIISHGIPFVKTRFSEPVPGRCHGCWFPYSQCWSVQSHGQNHVETGCNILIEKFKKNEKKLVANPKNNGRTLACSFYNWFVPSYQGVVAVITSLEGYGQPRLWCDLIR